VIAIFADPVGASAVHSLDMTVQQVDELEVGQ